MRKYMTKEVTVTKVMVGEVGFNEKMEPVVQEVEFIEILGDWDKEKATKRYTKSGGKKTVFNVMTETRTYKMKVEEFIKLAELVLEGDIDTETEEESEEE